MRTLQRRELLMLAGGTAALTSGSVATMVALHQRDRVEPSLEPFVASRSAVPKELEADVVIIGGGLGGVAAALGALRGGATVILTEEYPWIGGQLTSQLVPPDEHKWIEESGSARLYRRLRTDIRERYRLRTTQRLTDTARAKTHLNPGAGWVSRLCCEPLVAVDALKAMLAPHVASGKLQILQPWKATKVDVAGDVVRGITGASGESGVVQHLHARYFLDATEEGDLLPLAGVEHVTGFESQRDTGEPHAPLEARPNEVQSFTICCLLAYDPAGDFIGAKPADYDAWRDFTPPMTPPYNGKLMSMEHPTSRGKKFGFDPTADKTADGPNLWTYRRMIAAHQFEPGAYPGDLSAINWHQNDYTLGSLHAGVTPAEASKNLQKARAQTLALVYWLQTECPRPDGGLGWKGLQLAPAAAGTADGLAQAPYIRESRRIKAQFTVKEQHVLTDLRARETGLPKDQVRAVEFADSVGVGHYPMDLHASSAGTNGMGYSTLPFQIPLGSLLPIRMANFLPACKNLGVTHLTNGCYRLHPIEWNIGESAGALAAFCIQRQIPPTRVRSDAATLGEFQKVLRDGGVELAWPASARA